MGFNKVPGVVQDDLLALSLIPCYFPSFFDWFLLTNLYSNQCTDSIHKGWKEGNKIWIEFTESGV
jgi:hypothetical protein